jgi:hypothetical protein
MDRFLLGAATLAVGQAEPVEAPALPSLDDLPDDCHWRVEEGEAPVLIRGQDGTRRAGCALWWDYGIREDYDPVCDCHLNPPCSDCVSSWSEEAQGLVEEVGRAHFGIPRPAPTPPKDWRPVDSEGRRWAVRDRAVLLPTKDYVAADLRHLVGSEVTIIDSPARCGHMVLEDGVIVLAPSGEEFSWRASCLARPGSALVDGEAPEITLAPISVSVVPGSPLDGPPEAVASLLSKLTGMPLVEEPTQPTADDRAPTSADLLGMDTAWPLGDVLTRLADAADHLLGDHGCDSHGYEEVYAARDAARSIVAALNAPTTDDSDQTIASLTAEVERLSGAQILEILHANPAAALVAVAGEIKILGPRVSRYHGAVASFRRNIRGIESANVYDERSRVFAVLPSGRQADKATGESAADFEARFDEAWRAAGWTLVDELPEVTHG